MKSWTFAVTLLSLSIHSVHASLPYSIPDLDNGGFWLRDRETPDSSKRLLPPYPLGQGTLASSGAIATGSNTAPVLHGTGGVSSSTQIHSSPIQSSSRKSWTNSTTAISTVSSTQAQFSLIYTGPIGSTVVAASSDQSVAITTVLLITGTSSAGLPVVVTSIPTSSFPSSFSVPSKGQTAFGTQLTSASSEARSLLPQTSSGSVPQTPPGSEVSGKTPTNMPQPIQTPHNGEELLTQFPSLFVVDAVIDGVAYHLPQPNESAIEIMLLDGSLAQLLASQVVVHGQALEIPVDIFHAQPIVAGGLSITAQPGEAKKPDSDGHDGGGGPFAFLGKIVGAAESAAKTIGNIATDAAGFAAGTSGTSATALAGTFSTALKDTTGVVSSLNGIQMAFPSDSLTRTGMSTFLNAQNLGRSSVDWMRSTAGLLATFDTLKPDVQQRVRDNIREFTKPSGALLNAGAAMKNVAEFPWETQAPKTKLPSPTATPQSTGNTQTTKATSVQSSDAITTSASSSSSSATPSPTAQVLPYYIASKWGTSSDTFKRFTMELDGGVGKIGPDRDDLDYQTYDTNLNSTQAEGLLVKYPFLIHAYANIFRPGDLERAKQEEEFHAIPKTYMQDYTASETKGLPQDLEHDTWAAEPHSISPRALLPGDNNAPYWKKMISSPFQDPLLRGPSQDPAYVADDSGGRGTTVYVLDDGFDGTSPEFAARGRSVDTFFVSNDEAFPPGFVAEQRKRLDRVWLVDAKLSGGSGHGTKMATIAAGKTLGVAPNANLYLLKTKGQWNRASSTVSPVSDMTYSLQTRALRRAFSEIREHVRHRLEKSNTAKSVINMSWGVAVDPRGEGPDLEKTFKEFFEWCETFKITVVTAAGNSPEQRLHQTIPQKLGTASNRIITVGGVKKDGTLYELTTPAEGGQGGSITLYAPAEDVVVPSPGNNLHSGTSQAAAIVSGLVAYLYGVPNLGSSNPDASSPNENMKQFLASHAWTRISRDKLGKYYNLDVVYNLARGDTAHAFEPCKIGGLQNRDGAPVTACSQVHATSISNSLDTASASLKSYSTPTLSLITSERATTSTVRPSSSSETPTISVTPASSPSPTSDQRLAPTPPLDKCRIYVMDYDHNDSSKPGVELWNVGIYPDFGSEVRQKTAICMSGDYADEHSGIDVKCEPVGDAFHVLREKDNNLLHFNWGSQTWTSTDSKCKTVKDWYQFDAAQKEMKKRETECQFECRIDWTKPLSFNLVHVGE